MNFRWSLFLKEYGEVTPLDQVPISWCMWPPFCGEGGGRMLYPWCTSGKAGAELVSHGIASLLATLANPQNTVKFTVSSK